MKHPKTIGTIVLIVWGIAIFYLATAFQEIILTKTNAYYPYEVESAEVGK